MREFEMTYVGCATVDKRLSGPMVPWIIAQIHRGTGKRRVKVYVNGSYLCFGDASLEGPPMTKHSLNLVSRLSMFTGDLVSMFYVVRDISHPLLYCHLFQSPDPEDVMELMTAMKEQSNRVVSTRTSTTLCSDISPSSSQFFEVMYIGKIKVSHKKVPDTFIDDALDKFRSFEKQKKEREDADSSPTNSSLQENCMNGDLKGANRDFGSTEALKTDPNNDKAPQPGMMRRRSGSAGSVLLKKVDALSASSAGVETNRTMVFHVGRSDLRLVSLDRKQVLLHKQFKDITCSVQGTKHSSHFAFVCKESGAESCSYIGYVFNCQSSSVAEDVVSAIWQAVTNDKKSVNVVSCDHCPMVWYHKLCSEIEGLSERAAESAILKRLDLLPEEEQTIVRTKLEGAAVEAGAKQQTELLMMLLRAHCESKQARHVHDTPQNRHEFLSHYLGGGGTIFTRAKRSLTSSFDQLLKRKGSRDDLGPFLSLPPNTTLCKDLSNHIANDRNEGTTSSQTGSEAGSDSEEPQSPGSMLNIFRKVGSPISHFGEKQEGKETPHSWRQAIFNTVVTPSKVVPQCPPQKRDKEYYRSLWKKAINQQVLLIRMEKENAKLTARQEEANVKRIKLDYDEITPSDSSEVWEQILKDGRILEPKHIRQALQEGIPKAKRGDMWLYFAEQYEENHPDFDFSSFPNYDVQYDQLLQQLTSHQHAILIDLGRTLPSHPYFSSPLGPGQLSLFNLLKAYSLLDPEVGYCQGLSFVAAVFLLHMTEEQAFTLLKHVMIRRGLRARYLPDMAALQVALYQLSRLLHDKYPQLYAHFDALDVAPTLYAPPWLLTFFASTFPLGFVTRAFDMIFAESPDVMFRIVVALLGQHEEPLMKKDSFEAVMDHLKCELPQTDSDSLDQLACEVLRSDVSRELVEYGVEYHVLQEEMSTPRPETKRIRQLEIENEEVKRRLKATEQQLQIATSNITRLETTRSSHMSQLNKLESQVRSLEVSVSTLGEFISELGYTKQVEIPAEIIRIVTQLNISENRKRQLRESVGRRLSAADKISLQRPRELIGSKSPRREDKPLKSTQSAFELRPTPNHPLDTQTIPTLFEGTTPLRSHKPYIKRNTLSELRIVESADDEDIFRSNGSIIHKPFSAETQLLIKSQSPNKNSLLT